MLNENANVEKQLHEAIDAGNTVSIKDAPWSKPPGAISAVIELP